METQDLVDICYELRRMFGTEDLTPYRVWKDKKEIDIKNERSKNQRIAEQLIHPKIILFLVFIFYFIFFIVFYVLTIDI